MGGEGGEGRGEEGRGEEGCTEGRGEEGKGEEGCTVSKDGHAWKHTCTYITHCSCLGWDLKALGHDIRADCLL